MIEETVSWILNNKLAIVELYLAAIGLARIIVRITPTKKDDKILAKINGCAEKITDVLTYKNGK